MIENTLDSQYEVLELFSKFFNPECGKDDGKVNFEKSVLEQLPHDGTIQSIVRQWKRLDEDAERVEKSVRQESSEGLQS